MGHEPVLPFSGQLLPPPRPLQQRTLLLVGQRTVSADQPIHLPQEAAKNPTMLGVCLPTTRKAGSVAADIARCRCVTLLPPRQFACKRP
jgi:hypothetical protein